MRTFLLILGATVLAASGASAHPPDHPVVGVHRLARAEAVRPIQTIAVINRANVPVALLLQVEQAVAVQVNAQLRKTWGVKPIRFVAHASWNVTLEPMSWAAGNYHARCVLPTPGVLAVAPCAVITAGPPTAMAASYWSVAFSHEVLEMLVDPGGRGREVCDPVAYNTYTVRGVVVSDFVTPLWFQAGSAGPWDWLDATNAPQQTVNGGY